MDPWDKKRLVETFESSVLGKNCWTFTFTKASFDLFSSWLYYWCFEALQCCWYREVCCCTGARKWNEMHHSKAESWFLKKTDFTWQKMLSRICQKIWQTNVANYSRLRHKTKQIQVFLFGAGVFLQWTEPDVMIYNHLQSINTCKQTTNNQSLIKRANWLACCLWSAGGLSQRVTRKQQIRMGNGWLCLRSPLCLLFRLSLCFYGLLARPVEHTDK